MIPEPATASANSDVMADWRLSCRRQGYTLQQIADAEGVGLSTVWNRLEADPRYDRRQYRSKMGRPRSWTPEAAAALYDLAVRYGSIWRALEDMPLTVSYKQAERMIAAHREATGACRTREHPRYGEWRGR